MFSQLIGNRMPLQKRGCPVSKQSLCCNTGFHWIGNDANRFQTTAVAAGAAVGAIAAGLYLPDCQHNSLSLAQRAAMQRRHFVAQVNSESAAPRCPANNETVSINI